MKALIRPRKTRKVRKHPDRVRTADYDLTPVASTGVQALLALAGKACTPVVLIMALLLSACTPTRVDNPISRIEPPKGWRHAPPDAANVNPANLKAWWQGFRDQKLNALITQALANNHDLRIAVARVREAKAITTVAESALYPSIDLTASGGREKKD